MARPMSLTVAVAAALAFASAAQADEGTDMPPAMEAGTPVKLVEFNGEWEVLKASSRLRVWRSHLAYTISVDAQGNATECEVTEKFRRTYVNQKLCSVLMKHHIFEPARDASNAPVAGSYSARLSYMDLREKL